jgi:hypothetical protein
MEMLGPVRRGSPAQPLLGACQPQGLVALASPRPPFNPVVAQWPMCVSLCLANP